MKANLLFAGVLLLQSGWALGADLYSPENALTVGVGAATGGAAGVLGTFPYGYVQSLHGPIIAERYPEQVNETRLTQMADLIDNGGGDTVRIISQGFDAASERRKMIAGIELDIRFLDRRILAGGSRSQIRKLNEQLSIAQNRLRTAKSLTDREVLGFLRTEEFTVSNSAELRDLMQRFPNSRVIRQVEILDTKTRPRRVARATYFFGGVGALIGAGMTAGAIHRENQDFGGTEPTDEVEVLDVNGEAVVD